MYEKQRGIATLKNRLEDIKNNNKNSLQSMHGHIRNRIHEYNSNPHL